MKLLNLINVMGDNMRLILYTGSADKHGKIFDPNTEEFINATVHLNPDLTMTPTKLKLKKIYRQDLRKRQLKNWSIMTVRCHDNFKGSGIEKVVLVVCAPKNGDDPSKRHRPNIFIPEKELKTKEE